MRCVKRRENRVVEVREQEKLSGMQRALKVKQEILKQKDRRVAVKLKCRMKRQIKAEVTRFGTCPER